MENEVKYQNEDGWYYPTYTDPQGRKYVPVMATERFVFYRCEHYNQIFVRMHTVNNGQVGTRQARGFRPSYDNAEQWMRENSESMPFKIYPASVIETVNKAKCRDCDE